MRAAARRIGGHSRTGDDQKLRAAETGSIDCQVRSTCSRSRQPGEACSTACTPRPRATSDAQAVVRLLPRLDASDPRAGQREYGRESQASPWQDVACSRWCSIKRHAACLSMTVCGNEIVTGRPRAAALRILHIEEQGQDNSRGLSAARVRWDPDRPPEIMVGTRRMR